ncbi:hypothetical protein EIP91_000943 [Steccherinum ochraceum]|uniref:ABC transporter domain-containing protein n=1 Tax=Steccherinum ochraceum TaxID=92696 RepID=A0A4V2MWM4_9APHY|nr:hypothetical protein EIP91_000943 [Steccherinum ochraceum]
MPEKSEKSPSGASKPPNEDVVSYGERPSDLEEIRMGVWSILKTRKKTTAATFKLRDTLDSWTTSVREKSAIVTPFIKDVYVSVGPALFLVYTLSSLATNLEMALYLHLSNNLLQQIEATLLSGKPDPWAVCRALGLHAFFFVLLSTLIRWNMNRIEPTLRTRLKMHLQSKILKTHLSLDLPTFKEKNTRYDVNSNDGFNAFCDVLETINIIISIVSQMLFVRGLASHAGGDDGGLRLAMLCLASPWFVLTESRDLWKETFAVFAHNKSYLRSSALYYLATNDACKQDVLANDASDYLYKEYEEASEVYKTIPDDNAVTLYGRANTPFRSLRAVFLRDLPLFAYVLECLFYPERFSVATLAMLQQTFGQLRYTFERMQTHRKVMVSNIDAIKKLYDGMTVDHAVETGTLAYPAANEAGEKMKQGMKVELKDVSFAYPGDSEAREVLQNVSFTIPASSLVVIVGSNGSGKSSLVKLLSNLYRPKSGEIFIDHHPINSYRASDLRKATGLLSQDHYIFPMTVGESIGVGDPENAKNGARIQEATRLGLASEYVDKLPKKLDEVLVPMLTNYASQSFKDCEPFKDYLNKVEKVAEMSGGEKQRLGAARTFMRILSGNLKLLVVDEPTSAMDAEAERQIFKQLREMREGMTTILVTHRFGNLTRHADLILCMKDGKLVESGTHAEMMAKDGEYCRLYNIQAEGFAPDKTEEMDEAS